MLSNYLEAARESSSFFLSSLTSCYSKRSVLIALVLVVVSFSLFASLTPNALLNGDTVIYAEQISALDFSVVRVHLGYYLLGTAFTRLLGSGSDYTLNLMNCLLGALSIALLYLIGLKVYGKHAAAVIAGLFWGTNFLFLKNALYAEVYMAQAFFLLLALQLWLSDRPFLTGLSFAMSTLVSPSSLFALPCLLLLRPQKRPLLQFGATAFVVLAAVVLPQYRDYFFGGRGLEAATTSVISIEEAFLKELREVGYGFFLYAPFLLAGVVQLVKERQLRPLGVSIFALWLFNFLFAEKFPDVPVQLSTYALLCLVGGFGCHLLWAELKKHSRPGRTNYLLLASVALALIVGVNGFRAFTLINRKTDALVQYKATAEEINRIASPGYLIVGKSREALLFLHYSSPELDTKLGPEAAWLGTPWIHVRFLVKGGEEIPRQAEALQIWQQAIASGRQIWILEKIFPVFLELRKAGYTIRPFREVYRATLGQAGSVPDRQ